MPYPRPSTIAAMTLALLVAGALPAAAQDGWRHYAGDSFQRYSALEQIDAANVTDLEVVWRRPGLDGAYLRDYPELRPDHYHKTTPILVDGVLYASNAIGLVEAWDPATGETLWRQPPPSPQEIGGQSIRGVEYWSDGAGADRRIISVRGQYLYALDAITGEPPRGFGENGRVLLTREGPDALRFGWQSGPVVVSDVIVVGGLRGGSGDRARVMEREPEDVTGYDVRTGELLWTFHVVPREGEYGTETWENDSWRFAGDLGSWCCLSADHEIGYVYVPLSANSGSMWGGFRPGDNLFTNSLVALDARTGRRAWHYQMIHHGLWESDNMGTPVLGDFTVDGRRVQAVLMPNKNAFLFALDRVTGSPIWPIEERPVPQSPKVPGEHLSLTQPFPTKPAPFDHQGITEEDLIDFTPELRADALEFVQDYVLGPLYTPPTLVGDEPGEKKGTIQVPGSWGAANWHSTAFDPETGIVYIVSHTLTGIAAVAARPDSVEGTMEYIRVAPSPIFGPHGLPLTKPPYGRITAIDLKTGEHAWMAPIGDGPRDHPMLRDLDLPPLGYSSRPVPLVTGSLLFLGEGSDVFGGAGGDYQWGTKFRAFDKATGEVIWETDLGVGTTGGPMTYMHEGRQYLVVPVGDRQNEPEWIAFAVQP